MKRRTVLSCSEKQKDFFLFSITDDEHVWNVFMSLSVECKLKTWKTTIGKRKKSKSRLSGALSQKNVLGLSTQQQTLGETLFSSFALLLFCFVFPPQRKEMEEK
jgi:hypothetical protein